MAHIIPRRSVLSPLMAVAANLVIVYIVYSLARVEYLLENWSYFAQTVRNGDLPHLLRGGLVFDTPGIFYTNILYILMMLFPVHLKERHGWQLACKWVFITVNGICLAANLADSVYFGYTLKRTFWSVFSEFGTGNELGKVFAIEALRHWYLVLLFGLMIWGMWRLYVMPCVGTPRSRLVRYYIIAVVSLCVAALTTVSAIRGGFINHWYNYIAAGVLAYMAWRLLHRTQTGPRRAGWICAAAALILLCTAPVGGWRHRDIRPITLSNASAWTHHPNETALVLNTPFTMIRSIGKTEFADPHYYDDKSELDATYTPVHKPDAFRADTTAGRGKNLVVIIMESFGREYIGAMNHEILGADYKGYTPFVDSLLQHSAWWRYSYDNGRKSIDAMPSVLAGIPMFVHPYITTPQGVNKVKGIPAMLGEMGYETAFFHGARTGSMGFDGFARSIGFERYLGREDFEKDQRFDSSDDFDGYWGIWDEPFLQFFALQMTGLKQPFMTAIFTLSNHHPFQIPDKYKGRFPEGTLQIHKTVGYADNALRLFFETARRQPWYGNTVFVITNDHTNMRGHDEYRSDIGGFYGPILIYDPSGDITPGERNAVAQQTDIMPTMLNYLGVDRPYIAYGLDLLDTPADDTWAVNYNGNYQYVKYGLVLQWDGSRSVGLFSADDHLMANNLLDSKDPDVQRRRADMERELKAIIQSYMDRMVNDRMTAGSREQGVGSRE